MTCVSVRSEASTATSDIMPYILQKHTILRADNGGRKMSRNVGTFQAGVITQKRAILNLRLFSDSSAKQLRRVTTCFVK